MNRLTSVAMVQSIAVSKYLGYLTGRLLDVGCGSQPYRRLENNATEWVGLDIRPVGDIEADMAEMPCESESFDSVLCIDSLQYCLDPIAAFGEMVRVLKSGGVLLLIAPNVAPEDESACFDFKMRWLSLMCEAHGLEIQAAETASKMWEHSFANYAQTSKYGVSLPSDISAFTGQLDMEFPALNIILATKR